MRWCHPRKIQRDGWEWNEMKTVSRGWVETLVVGQLKRDAG